ncbi:hypothetical protein P175DRAFT_0533533 [Aspergillus ochraceoroseus IBT 24754]|uniref:Letm1 RBD domain-containing protein n=1 Tax=Aspergillus ochraceoroseus IBT 24754 TaxID=1392256 RepID=A0A2T5LS61_9EURO|nr:uncharacterized protein P175DRAFT_0533533 [Aspergillus ochraceoroseus IBT 24754]PTU19111.1 hypothetical protein P175DRAFT_0533533 [Aspergillus ochraceoroseus IBT 24754]
MLYSQRMTSSIYTRRALLSPAHTSYSATSLLLQAHCQARRFAHSHHSQSHSHPHPHPHSLKSHNRPPSSAQPTLRGATPSTSTTATTSLANDVNPPPSTRPADLNLPEALSVSAPPVDKLKRYIALGRAYLSFYKTGLKNVYHNYRASLPLRRSLGLTSYLPTSPPPAPAPAPSTDAKREPGSAAGSAFRVALKTQNLSRSNFQLISRAAYDVRRMIPFTLILIICGELTPLAVLALGNAVTPFTCRVPRQISKERANRVARKRAALVAHSAAVRGSLTPLAPGSDRELDLLALEFGDRGWVESASDAEVLRACTVFGLAKSHRRSGLLKGVYRGRLRRYAEYLDIDDGLIRKCGGVKAMEGVEGPT